MATIGEAQMQELLQPYLTGMEVPVDLYARIDAYLTLLLRWNARTNLTAVREPAQLVQRQVGESLFAARFVSATDFILDFGSGAGFPGIPLQLMRPAAAVTLAESQGKKASFLREAVRSLGLASTVWAGRVEDLPADQVFDVVAMRAVDHSARMATLAAARVRPAGSLLRFEAAGETEVLAGWQVLDDLPVPLSQGRLIRMRRSEMFHVEH